MRNGRVSLLFWLSLFLLLLVSASPIQAQNYRFSVPQLYMQVYVQPDASVQIVYDITFANSSGASPIDIVDIGTPHDGYDLADFRASVDGRELTDIRHSEYIDTGVEIHLGSYAIQPGRTGTLHVEFTMPDMVYKDVTQDGFASLQMTPTWFDSSLVTGNSDVWIVFHMLPNVNPADVLHQDVAFTDKAVYEEHAIVGWRWPNGSATEANLVGASFPTTGMTRVVEQTLIQLTEKWMQDNPFVTFILGLVTVCLVAFAFYRLTGGTGNVVFAMILIGMVLFFAASPITILCVAPLALIAVVVIQKRLNERKNRYLPAIAEVEGGGIKRGLTAPEAAILLELPLNKVLMLVLFGLLDKGTIELLDDNPLRVKVKAPYVQGKRQERRQERRNKAAQAQGITLRPYEHDFLNVLQEDESVSVHRQDFGAPMKVLIDHVVERMQGFDLSDTQDYYRKIIARAMAEAQRMGTVPELESHLDRTWPWVFLGDEASRTFRRGDYQYEPTWLRPYHYGPIVDASGSAGSSSGGSGTAVGGKTSFSQVAAGFAGWAENTAGSLANAISPTSLQVGEGAAGFINLSGVDKVTGDVFKALAEASQNSGGSGGSSGGSSCACACAGCACACACAGGGR